MFSVGVKDFLNRRSGVRLTPGLPFLKYCGVLTAPTAKALHALEFPDEFKKLNTKRQGRSIHFPMLDFAAGKNESKMVIQLIGLVPSLLLPDYEPL